jgi:hypothetical protein
MGNLDREIPERLGEGDLRLATVIRRSASIRVEIWNISSDENYNNFRRKR